jgi:hypothetical protein
MILRFEKTETIGLEVLTVLSDSGTILLPLHRQRRLGYFLSGVEKFDFRRLDRRSGDMIQIKGANA